MPPAVQPALVPCFAKRRNTIEHVRRDKLWFFNICDVFAERAAFPNVKYESKHAH